jgi:hypothetical protein
MKLKQSALFLDRTGHYYEAQALFANTKPFSRNCWPLMKTPHSAINQ